MRIIETIFVFVCSHKISSIVVRFFEIVSLLHNPMSLCLFSHENVGIMVQCHFFNNFLCVPFSTCTKGREEFGEMGGEMSEAIYDWRSDWPWW